MKTWSRTRLAALGLALALALGAVSAATSGVDEDDKADLVGYFTDASPLDPGSEVRAAGVRVGTVKSINLHDGAARVVLDVDRDILPVHRDATLIIKPINVLGETYIDLDEGTPEAPMLNSGEIPIERTSSSVTLQDVLNTFNNPTATGLAALIETLGTGFEGSGAEVAAALRKLAPSMVSTEKLGRILDAHLAALTSIIRRVHPVADALADGRGRTLDTLVENTTTVLSALSSQQQALQSSIRELPPTLATTVVTLNNLSEVTHEGAPLLRSLRPVTNNLTDISAELTAFTGAANPVLEQLAPLVDDAGALLEEAGPIARQLRISGEDLKGAARGLRPIGYQLLNKNLYGLMEFVRKWALSTNSRDGLSHYFRGVFHVTPASLNSLLGSDVVPSLPAAGKEDGAPGLELPLNLDDTVAGLLNGVVPNLPGGVNGALGLNSDQEANLLNQLLGGK